MRISVLDSSQIIKWSMPFGKIMTFYDLDDRRVRQELALYGAVLDRDSWELIFSDERMFTLFLLKWG